MLLKIDGIIAFRPTSPIELFSKFNFVRELYFLELNRGMRDLVPFKPIELLERFIDYIPVQRF